MNYREKYKKHYGIEFSEDYVVHHINHNRDDNDIENLLLLPKILHQQYHFYYERAQFDKFDKKIKTNEVSPNNNTIEMMFDFLYVYKECQKWADYKLYLEGKLPNIHNIRLKGIKNAPR